MLGREGEALLLVSARAPFNAESREYFRVGIAMQLVCSPLESSSPKDKVDLVII